jgi:hypothetical protein
LNVNAVRSNFHPPLGRVGYSYFLRRVNPGRYALESILTDWMPPFALDSYLECVQTQWRWYTRDEDPLDGVVPDFWESDPMRVVFNDWVLAKHFNFPPWWTDGNESWDFVISDHKEYNDALIFNGHWWTTIY